jgi:putative nucleotidyltransferase with HDIG domain
MKENIITEEMLDDLRNKVCEDMSEKRFRHTAEVEKMVARLCELYAPEKSFTLRAAALLHDITKEYSSLKQIELCARYGLTVTECDLNAPKTFHARTAAAMIPDKYPEFDVDEVVSCVRWHTTGRAGMTLCEQLVYLADYIDMSRSFPDCVTLRNYFFDASPEKMDSGARIEHLRRTLLMSFDMTIRGLIDDGAPVSVDSMNARNELICLIKGTRVALGTRFTLF